MSLTPPKNLSVGVVDTGEQFFGGVVDTGNTFSAFWLFLTGINDKKFIAGVVFAGVVYTGDKH